MISRSCVEKIGVLDESFFLYSEETEYELRASDHGFCLVLAPDATAVHLGGVSRIRPELWALTCANKVRLYGMRNGPVAARVFWAGIVVGELVRANFGRSAIRKAALSKLYRERRTLVHGNPARHPYKQY
jgi:GT2 family glycosyltransferase